MIVPFAVRGVGLQGVFMSLPHSVRAALQLEGRHFPGPGTVPTLYRVTTLVWDKMIGWLGDPQRIIFHPME